MNATTTRQRPVPSANRQAPPASDQLGNALAVQQQPVNTSAGSAIAQAANAAPPPPPAVTPEGRKFFPLKTVKAILAITREIGAVEKRGYNEFHKYNYQKWEDVMNHLQPLLVQHNLLIIPSEVSRSIVDKLVSITYEFSIFNEDGEEWPDRPQLSASARLVDGKGTFDDKAVNKCHTQGQKYFYIGLFKIKTADIDDSDGDDKNGGQQQRRAVPSSTGKVPPHKIEPSKSETFQTWKAKYVAFIEKAETEAELLEWDNLNNDLLGVMHDKNKQLYDDLMAAWEKKRDSLPADKRTTLQQTAQPAQQQDQPEEADFASEGSAEDDGSAEDQTVEQAFNPEQWLATLKAKCEAVPLDAPDRFAQLGTIQAEFMMPQKERAGEAVWQSAMTMLQGFISGPEQQAQPEKPNKRPPLQRRTPPPAK